MRLPGNMRRLMVWLLLLVSASAAPLDLVVSLLDGVGQGKSAVQSVAELAHIIVETCHGFPADPSAIARFHSVPRGHAERDLHRWARRQPWMQYLPCHYGFEIDAIATRGEAAAGPGNTLPECINCILPHEMFGAIWRGAPDFFFCRRRKDCKFFATFF